MSAEQFFWQPSTIMTVSMIQSSIIYQQPVLCDLCFALEYTNGCIRTVDDKTFDSSLVAIDATKEWASVLPTTNARPATQLQPRLECRL
jgi:hypothetical protein